MNTNVALWVGFNLFVLAMLALDLGVFHRKEHVVSPKEAGLWTVVWIVLSLSFCGMLGLSGYWNHEQSLQWVTAYVVEYALSVDNLFVFIMVFGFFRVPLVVQHRVLFWGILGALAMRGAGCVYNDIVDRKLDAQVERTRDRPLASGRVSLRAAWNWLFALSSSAARAMDTVPRTCGNILNSALRSGSSDPPRPVAVGSPVWAMKPSITRWNFTPS